MAAIRVHSVSKEFILPHYRSGSFKSAFTGMFQSHDKRIEVQHALKHISFDVQEGEFFGIVGRNGSGKSTLLKMLAGIYQPTSGTIELNGKLVPFIELGVGFNPELSGRDNVYLNGALLGFSRAEIDEQYEDIVHFAELERFMDQKLKNYSSGMQVRLAFSMATRAKADILLVDEVLAVGDASFQRKCFEYFKELKANKKTVVFVTHDMNAVREYCDRAMLIDNSELKLIGDPQDVAREYALLFIDNDEEKSKKDGSRWGNGVARFSKVTASIKGDNLVVDASVDVADHIDKLAFGLHVFGADGQEITAMNNRMINESDIKDVASGSKIHFQWTMLNVFNDGSYTVSLTLVNDVGDTLDWFNQAASFTVRRAERSTTPVLPPVSVSHKITPQGSN